MGTTARLHITRRDLAILELVHLCGGLITDLIRRRFFRAPGARSSAFRRVAKLVATRYLKSTRLPSLHTVGSGKAFLTLGPAAKPLLSEVLGIPPSEMARSRARSPLFLAHHIAVSEFTIALIMAAEPSPLLHLEEWIPERELRRAPMRLKDPKDKRTVTLVPDGFFTLGTESGTGQSFFVEMDMGTVAPRRMKDKIRHYLASHRHHRTPILFVVPSTTRIDHIDRWTRAEASGLGCDPTIVWVAGRDSVNDTSVLSKPIWRVAGGPRSLAIEQAALPVAPPSAPHPHA